MVLRMIMLLKYTLNASIFPILQRQSVQDNIINIKSLQQFFDHTFGFLNYRLEIFPEGKHIIHLMYTEKFVSIVDDFLSSMQ